MRRYPLLVARVLAIAAGPVIAFAQDFGDTKFKADTGAGSTMVQEVGTSTNNITNLLMGPGMYVIMALGAIIALYGFGRGQKETLFTGIGLFVFSALLRGIWAFL